MQKCKIKILAHTIEIIFHLIEPEEVKNHEF